MATVNFFTTVSFGNQHRSNSQSLLETVDSYFYLRGEKAYVVPGHLQQESEGTVLVENSSPFLITALKVFSYCTIVIPIVMLIAKAILRSIHNFHIIDVKQKIEEGIHISQDTVEKIQALSQKIQYRQADDEIIWHHSQHRVFNLKSVPNLIFKRVSNANSRFENMVKAQKICLIHELGLLIIPHAKLFRVGAQLYIAEECLPIQPQESAQERLYTELSGLNETARQLAIFIAKTGFSDVEWRNMPIVDDEPDFPDQRRVALIDLEEMQSAATGIFGGGLGRRGLIACLSSEEQMDIALAEAQRLGIRDRWRTPEQVKARRMEEVQNYRALQEFYKEKGILENPRQLIQVDDLATLGLNLEEQGTFSTYVINGPDEEDIEKSITLRDAVIDVINQINEAITNAPENRAIKGLRYILLNINKNENLKAYADLGLPQSQLIITKEEKNQLWLPRIINALVDQGHLFKLVDDNGHGYLIQA